MHCELKTNANGIFDFQRIHRMKPGKKIRQLLYGISSWKGIAFSSKIEFMNLGYVNEKTKNIATLESAQRCLYEELIQAGLRYFKHKPPINALEIGCGRGGGCELLHRRYGLTNVTGIDRDWGNIRIARKKFPKVEFIRADAIDFHIEKKFDLILNLESAHAYTSLEKFFAKVKTNLSEDGVVVLADIVNETRLEKLNNAISHGGLEIIEEINLSEGVIKSIQLHSITNYPVATKYPWIFPFILHNFFVTLHSRTYNKLKKGTATYPLFVIRHQR
jgi:2-polyprenyl-3-methyl-5-hydroxy-6-metoxy-1,4-benzoquinol methylase